MISGALRRVRPSNADVRDKIRVWVFFLFFVEIFPAVNF